MHSLDLFSVRALMRAFEQIYSTTDLAVFPEVLFSAVKGSIPNAMVTFDHLEKSAKTNLQLDLGRRTKISCQRRGIRNDS
jgi:hypothetical protein